MLAYRHAQLARRKHELAHGGADPGPIAEVRSARAEACSAVYKLELPTDDPDVRVAAYALLAHIKQLKIHTAPDLLDVEGAAVHHGIQEFVATARERLGFIP
ncbi:MAG: hypothetical protein V9F04_07335 [Dermatophilaceae bacterium]